MSPSVPVEGAPTGILTPPPSLLTPRQIKSAPSGQKPPPHLTLNLKRWVGTRQLAARARYRDALAIDCLSQPVSAVQIGQRAFKQKPTFCAVAAIPYKLAPQRLRALRKVPWRLRGGTFIATFHVSIPPTDFSSHCERNPDPV